MKLTKRNGAYLWHGVYQTKHLPKDAGFRWHGNCAHLRKCYACEKYQVPQKVWWTDDPVKASNLLFYAANDNLKMELADARTEHKKKLEQSKATNSSFRCPSPIGTKFLPFQLAGIEAALRIKSDSYKGCLIGDEMGLGKTIQAIGFANVTRAENILIICPASLRRNWEKEWWKWTTQEHLDTGVVVRRNWVDASVVIINYDVLKQHKERIQARKWDLVILDECHYLKNPKAQRTKMVFGGKGVRKIQADFFLGLTGTPILNRPIELWPIANSFYPSKFSSMYYYGKRYCDLHHNGFGLDWSGASNLGELQDILRSSFMIRRKKNEVLTELPAKRRQLLEIPPNGAESLLLQEQKLMEEWKDKLEELRQKVELAKAEDESIYKNAVANLRESMGHAFTDLAKIRHMIAEAKIPIILETIRNASDKVVFFAHHQSILERIKSELGDSSVLVYGPTSLDNRQAAVERFQEDDSCRVFLGSIKAAGVGITLTASSHVIFGELDWTPSWMSQAEDRCHRIGQKDSVLVQHIVFDNSLDSRMAKLLLEKQKIIDEALDDKLPEKSEPVFPTEGETYSRKEIQEGPQLPDDQVTAIHQALIYLAQCCDGAMSYDGMGFNKFDNAIGKSLACRSALTNKQAVLGQKILRKYRKQLGEELYGEIFQSV